MEQPKIIQISSSSTGMLPIVFGLGDDNKVYYWDKEHYLWKIYNS